MDQPREKPAAGTPEFFAARQIACELMLRALLQMHPNKEFVEKYLDRMLGQTLAQPFYLDHPGEADLLKEVLSEMRFPAPVWPPEDL